jgi:hypothetical protein
VHGLGVVVAAKLLGHVGDVGRFPSQDHFASYTATAPWTPPAATSSATAPATSATWSDPAA